MCVLLLLLFALLYCICHVSRMPKEQEQTDAVSRQSHFAQSQITPHLHEAMACWVNISVLITHREYVDILIRSLLFNMLRLSISIYNK